MKIKKPKMIDLLVLINLIITIILIGAFIAMAYFFITQPDNFMNFFEELINEIKSFFNLIFNGFLNF